MTRDWIMPRGKNRRIGPVIGPDGTEYDTQAAAATALGISQATVHYHLEAHGHLRNVGGPRTGRKVPFKAYGREWPSLSAFADAVGVSLVTVWKWRKHGRRDLIKRAIERAEGRA